MRPTVRLSLLAILACAVLIVSACSTESSPPESLAFEEESSSSGDGSNETTNDEAETDTTVAATSSQDSTSSVAPTTTAEDTTARVDRPRDRDCAGGDVSLAFAENVILIAPNRVSQGPFTVDIPAGTYNLTMQTWLGFEDLADHTAEQWYFTTDSGYTSPITADSSPDLIASQVFANQEIPASRSITVFHAAPGSTVTNSVHPLCIGLALVPPPTTTTTAAPTTTTEAPPETEAPTGDADTLDADASATTAAPTTTAPSIAAPTTTAAAPAAESTDQAPAELALTGPGDLSFSIALAGASLTLGGLAMLQAARRRDD